MRVIGIVPARGGSKGILGKNKVQILGKPLLAYTAEEAARSALMRTIISTDDEEIAQIAREVGLEVPFMRPSELAQDDTPTVPVLQHAIEWLAAHGETYDAVMTLQPTNPLRVAADIDGAIALLETTGADSVISVCDAGENHPARMKFLDEVGRLIDPPFAESAEGLRRQALPKVFWRDGAIYLTQRKVLMEQSSLKGKDCRAWIIPRERGFSLNEPLDLILIEAMLKHRVTAATR